MTAGAARGMAGFGALEIVAEIVRAYNEHRRTAAALTRAEAALTAAMSQADERRAFLVALVEERHQGRLPDAAASRLLVAAGRLLKDQVALVEECCRMVSEAQRRS